MRSYEETTKDVSKWQSIVKANREAATLKFATGCEDVQRTSTTAALTAKFAPARDFEREIAGMLEAAGAHNEAAVQEAEEALALKVCLWLLRLLLQKSENCNSISRAATC